MLRILLILLSLNIVVSYHIGDEDELRVLDAEKAGIELPLHELKYHLQHIDDDEEFELADRTETKSKEPICACSTHLWWHVNWSDYSSIKTLEFHITVIPNSYAKRTYFAAAGSFGGYTGIQQRGYDKCAIFSLWDGHEDVKGEAAYLIEKGPNTKVNDFWGEGTGVRTNIPLDWKVDVPISFTVTIKPLNSSHGSVRADVEMEGKKYYMATLGRPKYYKALSKWFYSFIEDYYRPYGSEGWRNRRSIKFTDVYYVLNGERVDIKSSWFTRNTWGYTEENYNLAMAGVVDGKFWHGTGGKTDQDQMVKLPAPKYECEGDKCLAYIPERLSFDESVLTCSKYNGRLPIIKSEEKQKKILTFSSKFPTCLSDQYVWMSLNDKELEGRYVWADGTILHPGDYDKRSASDTGHNVQDCFVLGIDPKNYWYYTWSDDYCTYTYPCTVCEEVTKPQYMRELPQVTHVDDSEVPVNGILYYHNIVVYRGYTTNHVRGDPAKPAATNHLWWNVPIPSPSTLKSLEFHITIIPFTYAKSTYFAAAAFKGGSCGIQQTKTNKLAIFILENGPTGKAYVVEKGEGTTVKEEEAVLMATFPFQWKVDTKINFVVKIVPIDSSAWSVRVDVEMEGKTVHLGTFGRPGHVVDSNFNSYIEDFDRSDGAVGYTKRRSLRYSDVYSVVDGKRTNINDAKYTKVTTGLDAVSHLLCTAGVTDMKFLLGTGGFTPQNKISNL